VGKQRGTGLTVKDLRHELDVAVRLAQQAGEAILSAYRPGVAVDYKADDEPVTAADRSADALISEGLRAAFPDDGLLTEESDDDGSRLEKARVWIVDPLDGTTEFIAGTGDFVVQIALTAGGQPLLGVIYQPTTAALYYAVQGQGSHHVWDGQATRLRVSTVTDPSQMCLVASRAHYTAFLEAARQALGIESVNRAGSTGLKVARVARGDCDLYLATNVAKEWDLCAPDALLREAGGLLTNLCGEPMVYNQPELAACRGLIASNGLVHHQIVQSLLTLCQWAKR
jgi:3'(2'), 5'-bisphosphate nucleotidase